MSEFFDIPGDVVREAEAAQGFDLAVPEHARVKGNVARWNEAGIIAGIQAEQVKSQKGDEHTICVLEIKINHEGSGNNAGRTIFSRGRINFASMRKRDKDDGQYKMSRITIARLNALFKSLSYEPDREDGGFSSEFLSRMFPPQSSFNEEPSPILNRNVYFEVTRTENRSDKENKPLPPQCEITAFFPPE